MTRIIEATIPADSALSRTLADADFHDAYEAPLVDPALSPTEIFLIASRATPGWVDFAMSLRNRIVQLVGLKDVGSMRNANNRSAADYRVGDALGIFNVLGKSENELLLGIDDRHLDVRVSVMKAQRDGLPRYVVSTVVHAHNWLGHFYMAPVGRIHPIVVKAMMRRTRV